MLNKILRTTKKLIPKKLFKLGQPTYHYLLVLLGAMIYRFPGRKMKIVAVTGTKGKTSTVEFVNAILEGAGKKTALAGTLRFKIGENSKPNMYKMTMPGRFFIQKFLRNAVTARCEYAVIEISSEAVKQYRNKFIYLDALIFTNLAPEHIESHGSYEIYGQKFLDINIDEKIGYSLREAENIILSEENTKFIYKNVLFDVKFLGKFNIYNILSAIKYAEHEKIGLEKIRETLAKMDEIKGRAQKIDEGQNFKVIVDYAHTPDSLKAIYDTFPNSKKIAVLGNCGGGRDKWKRKEMAEIADSSCQEIILTDEDPYDDDPMEIISNMAQFFKNKKPEIVLDRRDAIRKAFQKAKAGDVVIITGKGTDPYIMRANGVKEKWSDAEVAREELRKLLGVSY